MCIILRPKGQGLLRKSPTEQAHCRPCKSRSDSFAWAPSKPSVEDIECRIVVAVEHDSAVDTHVCSHTEVFVLTLLATRTAHLAGFLWINLHDGNTGPFCLVFNQFDSIFLFYYIQRSIFKSVTS